MKDKPIQVGPLLVKRVPSSSVRYCAVHEHYWYGYIVPGTLSKSSISEIGKLIEVTSIQQLNNERDVYRAEIDSFTEVEFAYYEVIDAGSV